MGTGGGSGGQTVVVVGAGAAGIFTAYEIEKRYPGRFDVRLFEAAATIGGNVSSLTVEYGGQTYVVDAGAQFFSAKAQPNYTNLIQELGLAAETPVYPAGITIWDAAADERLLWVPSTVRGLARYSPADWARLVEFGAFVVAAAVLNATAGDDWSTTVDEWLADVPVTEAFGQDVVKSFLYQFVSLPYADIGGASAVYATTYLFRTLFGTPSADAAAGFDPGAIPLFTTNQSLVGLLGILQAALAQSGVTPELSSPVTAVAPGDGTVAVTVGGSTIEADYVVMACDPGASAQLLQAGGTAPGDLVGLLSAIGDRYLELTIDIQQDGACWMPSDQSYWEAVTTLVDVAEESVAFSAWFGPLRPPYGDGQLIPVFKSWGSPDLQPVGCAATTFSHRHDVPLPTTDFVALRDQLGPYQGVGGLCFAGGWTDWFDSQEAALVSAMAAAELLQPAGGSGTGGGGVVAYDPGAVPGQVRSWLDLVSAHAPEQFAGQLAALAGRLR